MNNTETEKGSAEIVISLRNGGVSIAHGECGTILRDYPRVTPDTWEIMFDTITQLLERRKQK